MSGCCHAWERGWGCDRDKCAAVHRPEKELGNHCHRYQRNQSCYQSPCYKLHVPAPGHTPIHGRNPPPMPSADWRGTTPPRRSTDTAQRDDGDPPPPWRQPPYFNAPAADAGPPFKAPPYRPPTHPPPRYKTPPPSSTDSAPPAKKAAPAEKAAPANMTAPPPEPAPPTIDACAQVFKDAVHRLFAGLSPQNLRVKAKKLLLSFHDDRAQADSLILFLRPSVHYLTNIIDRS